jgi:hypothetical protein
MPRDGGRFGSDDDFLTLQGRKSWQENVDQSGNSGAGDGTCETTTTASDFIRCRPHPSYGSCRSCDSVRLLPHFPFHTFQHQRRSLLPSFSTCIPVSHSFYFYWQPNHLLSPTKLLSFSRSYVIVAALSILLEQHLGSIAHFI